jgi:heat shock protein HslJ
MKRLSAHITVLLILLWAISVTGCNNGETQSTLPPQGDSMSSELNGTQWALHSINDSELIEDSHISLHFRDGSFWGYSGCNIYGGNYSTEAPDTLIISGGDMTAMNCSSPEGVMEQENAYFDSLYDAAFYHVAGEHLEINDTANQRLLLFERKPEYPMEPADLVGTSWLLVSIDGDYATEGLSITLLFDSDSIASGSAGCFDYELHYEASGDDIRWGMSTTRNGELPPELESKALQYTDSLMWGANYRLAKERLEIFTARGETLVFEPFYSHN